MRKEVVLKKLNPKRLFLTLLIILLVVVIFTYFDYLIHQLSEDYSVPPRYFPNKIIYGTLIGFITYLIINKQKLIVKSLIFSAVVSLLLQVRYFLEGYPLKFILEFLFIHFVILLVVSSILFKVFDKHIKFS